MSTPDVFPPCISSRRLQCSSVWEKTSASLIAFLQFYFPPVTFLIIICNGKKVLVLFFYSHHWLCIDLVVKVASSLCVTFFFFFFLRKKKETVESCSPVGDTIYSRHSPLLPRYLCTVTPSSSSSSSSSSSTSSSTFSGSPILFFQWRFIARLDLNPPLSSLPLHILNFPSDSVYSVYLLCLFFFISHQPPIVSHSSFIFHRSLRLSAASHPPSRVCGWTPPTSFSSLFIQAESSCGGFFLLFCFLSSRGGPRYLMML